MRRDGSANLQKSVRNSELSSSFGVTSEEDSDEEDDDFITGQEFEEYKNTNDAEIQRLKTICEKTIQDNMRMIKKVDQIDWTIVQQAEEKLAGILGEFQLSVDALLGEIEADMKRWKTQQATLETKYETMAMQ